MKQQIVWGTALVDRKPTDCKRAARLSPWLWLAGRDDESREGGPGETVAIDLEGDSVFVNAMHRVTSSVRVAVDGEVHHAGASETRRFCLK